MGSILNRSGDEYSWILKYDLPRDSNEKRKIKYERVLGTKAQARALLVRRECSIAEGKFVEQKLTPLCVWLDSWLQNYAKPQVSLKTFERYSQLIDVHIRPRLGNIIIQRLSSTDIHAFYLQLNKTGFSNSKLSRQIKMGRGVSAAVGNEGLSPRTIRHVHQVLSMVLAEAVRSGQLDLNPIKDLKVPRFVKHGSTADSLNESKAFTALQLKQLLRTFEGSDLHLIMLVAAGTGMRQGELLALRWSDVNFDRQIVSVRRSVESTKDRLRFKTPKSGKSREVPLESGLAIKLDEYRTRQINQSTGVVSLVFPKSIDEPEVPLSRFKLSRAVSKASTDLGFSGHSFHSLRHTFASLCLAAENPVPLSVLSRCLGHSNVGITASIYSHFVGDESSRTVKAVGKFLDFS